MKSRTFSLAEALQFGFKKTIDNFGLFLSLLLTVVLVYIIRLGGIMLAIGYQVIQSMISEHPNVSLSPATFEMLFNAKLLTGLLVAYVLFKLVDGIVAMGITQITLNIYDYDKSSYNKLFSCINLVFQHFFASLFYICMVGFGLLFFIVPGVYLAIRYGFYQHAMVDKKLGAFSSLSYSAHITHNNKSDLFIFFLVIWLMNTLATSFFGIGLLLTIPITWLAQSYVYRRLLALPQAKASA